MDKSEKHNVNERSHSLKNTYKNPHKVPKRALLIYSMRIQDRLLCGEVQGGNWEEIGFQGAGKFFS